jgi:hypothetical protein
MRKLNVSGILDRNIADHVQRIDSQIKDINQMMQETNMVVNGIFGDQAIHDSTSTKK